MLEAWPLKGSVSKNERSSPSQRSLTPFGEFFFMNDTIQYAISFTYAKLCTRLVDLAFTTKLIVGLRR